MKRLQQDRGQAILEMAGILPLIVVVLALLLQMSVATYAVAHSEGAARAGARAAAATPSDPAGAADVAARDALGSWLANESTNSLRGETVTVTIDVPLLFPGTPISLGSITADATIPKS